MNSNKYSMIAIVVMAALAVAIPIAGFAIKNVAFAAQNSNSCNNSLVGACVATGPILNHNKVQAGVCANVLANGLCRITGTQ
jgi:hypothetical protein